MAALLLAAMSVGALCTLVVSLRRPSARTVSWSPGGLFLLILAWIGTCGYALGALTGQRRTTDYFFGFNTRYFGISQIVIFGTGAATLIFCLLALRVWVRRESIIGLLGLLAVSISCLGIFTNVLNNVETTIRQNIALCATLAALLVATVIPARKDAVLGPAVYGLSVGIVSGIVPAVNLSSGFEDCRLDKCGPMGVLFLGALGNENALGLALALSFPFVLLAFRGYARWIFGSYMFAMIYLSGSRVALGAAVVTLGVAFVCNPRIEGGSTRGRLPAVATLTGLVAMAAGWIIPFSTTDLTAFSGRGRIWDIAKSSIVESPWLGSGAEAWRALVHAGEISAAGAYSTHNLWVDALLTTGVIGLALVVLLLVTIVKASSPWLIALPLITVLTVGILELPWTFAAMNWLVWVLPALLLLRDEPAPRDRGPASAQTRAVSKFAARRSKAHTRPARSSSTTSAAQTIPLIKTS